MTKLDYKIKFSMSSNEIKENEDSNTCYIHLTSTVNTAVRYNYAVE